MLRIASGVTDQYLYFYAGDIGLASFTVYRSRNGAAAAVMTTPTINETDSSDMPGVYELLMDEDMTIGSGNLTEHMAFFITHAGIAPIFKEIELFAPANYTIGTVTTNTDMRGTDSAATAADLAALQTAVNVVDALVDAIKAKTDDLTFTVANKLDINIQTINDVDLIGDGSGTPFNV